MPFETRVFYSQTPPDIERSSNAVLPSNAFSQWLHEIEMQPIESDCVVADIILGHASTIAKRVSTTRAGNDLS